MLMLAAVLLAGAGTFFIGGQTLQLRHNLEDAAHNATMDLQAIGEETHKTLNEQRQNLIGDIDRRRVEINDALARATEQIKDLDQLKEKAVKQIVDTILDKSTDLEARLRREIADNLAKIENNDVHDLKGRADALQLNIKQIETEIDDGSRQLKGSQPDLQRIIQLTRDADKLEAELGAIAHARTSAVEASEKTEAAHLAAQAAATDAARMRQELAEKMRSISTEIDADQRNLGIAQERLNKISGDTNQASNTTGELAKSVGGINERLQALDRQLTGAEDEITKLRNRPQQAQQITAPGTPPAPAFVEADLTRDQWRLIQNSLKARGFSLVRVDGWPGPLTRAAIGSFQTKMGAPSTGHLTSEQFDLLIRPQSTDKHQ
jgi:chromosome segregation ATPase